MSGASVCWIFGSGREPSESANVPCVPACPPGSRGARTDAIEQHRDRPGPLRSDPEAHRLADAAAEPARAARIGADLAPVHDERRQALDHLGGHAGDAAGEAGVADPVLVGRAPVPPAEVQKNVNGRLRVDAARLGDPDGRRALGHHALGRHLRQRAEDRAGQEVADDVPRGDAARAGRRSGCSPRAP